MFAIATDALADTGHELAVLCIAQECDGRLLTTTDPRSAPTGARNPEAKPHDAYRLGPSIFKSWVLIIQHRPGLPPRLI